MMKKELLSQYNNVLHMLANVIEICPEKLWDDELNYENTYWRIVYHTLFYTALYLAEDEEHFKAWEKHKMNYNRLGNLTDEGKPIITTTRYTKTELSGYLLTIASGLDKDINEDNTTSPSGFYWLPMNKFELYLYNLRHIQHHTGQLIERLHANGITGVAWY